MRSAGAHFLSTKICGKGLWFDKIIFRKPLYLIQNTFWQGRIKGYENKSYGK